MLTLLSRLVPSASVVSLDAPDAVAWLETHADSVCAVLCDLQMPEIDGLACFRVAQTRWPALSEHWIFWSATPSNAARKTGCPVLGKPPSFQELQRLLVAWTGN